MRIIHSLACLVLTFISFNPCKAEQAQTILNSLSIDQILQKIYEWGNGAQGLQEGQIQISGPIVVAGVLCFISNLVYLKDLQQWSGVLED